MLKAGALLGSSSVYTSIHPTTIVRCGWKGADQTGLRHAVYVTFANAFQTDLDNGRQLCGRRSLRHICPQRHPVRSNKSTNIGLPQSKPFSALTKREEFGELFRAIRNYGGSAATRIALQLMALTFLRCPRMRMKSQ